MDWLMPHLTPAEKVAVEACMALFDDPASSRDLLDPASKSLATLQKRFTTLNPAQRVNPELRGRTLVCTVGFRPLPVVLSILLLQPARVYLLHSRDSCSYAESIARDPAVQELGLYPDANIELEEVSLTSAPDNYRMLQTIIEANRDRKIVVDITGGVKVMGLSLAAAAFWLRIPVVYQLGEEINSFIRPFSEQMTELANPYDHFGATDLYSIQELFCAGDYDAAYAVCRAMQETVGDVQILEKLGILEEFITIYRDWDNFVHSHGQDDETRKLATRLRVALGRMRRLAVEVAEADALQANLQFLEGLEGSWLDTRNNAEFYRLIDIYGAALRRGRAGKYDDAVARLYRCVEMSATICLVHECGMGNVDRSPDFAYFIEQFGSHSALARSFHSAAGYKLESNRLGMKTQMLLLSLSAEPRHRQIAQLYQTLADSDLMEFRNRSTLAHGTVPVSQHEYREFDAFTRQIIEATFAEADRFQRMLAAAQHPHIRINF